MIALKLFVDEFIFRQIIFLVHRTVSMKSREIFVETRSNVVESVEKTLAESSRKLQTIRNCPDDPFEILTHENKQNLRYWTNDDRLICNDNTKNNDVEEFLSLTELSNETLKIIHDENVDRKCNAKRCLTTCLTRRMSLKFDNFLRENVDNRLRLKISFYKK